MEYYTLTLMFFVGVVCGWILKPIKNDICDISAYKYHPKTTFNIPIIWYEYVYRLHTVDFKTYDVRFYGNNLDNNEDIVNAIHESINCARNKIIGNSIVIFIKPVYDIVIKYDIADIISNISYVEHKIVDFNN